MSSSVFRWIQLFFIVQVFFIVTACRENYQKKDDDDIALPYCQIENIKSYYNGLSFSLKMSLDFDCFDMDEFVSAQRLFRPYWIETIGDTLFMKKHPLRGPIISDSCKRAGNCPGQTIMSLARMRQSNLKMKNYNWFINWQKQDDIFDETFFPLWAKKMPFVNFSQKCLKLEIPCFMQKTSLEPLYDDSSPTHARVMCLYCN